MSPIPVDTLPTLRDLYDANTLEPHTNPIFPALEEYLDKIVLWRGDVTQLQVDVIVNAANKSLLGGGGVDGAIHRAAGPELLKECRTLHGANTGEAKITKGYNLPAKHVIHAVGPVYGSNSADECAAKLRCCYENIFRLAVKNHCKSIGMVGISTGIYSYPLHDATHIALSTTRKHLGECDSKAFDKIVFVLFRPEDVESYEKIVPSYFPAK